MKYSDISEVLSAPKKNVHVFTDNFFRKVSSGQICPRFLRTYLSYNIVEVLTIQKADPPLFYPLPPKIFIVKKEKKTFNFAGTEPNTPPLTPISSLLR